jgi:hypothetical protein
LNLDHGELFAVLGVAGVAALYRAATMRGDLSEQWSTRVEVAEAGLADRATTEALKLQDEIADLIGSEPPRLATVDPAPLAHRAADFQKTLIIGNRLPMYFQWLLRLGPAAIGIAAAFLLALAAVFLDNAEIVMSELLRVGGIVLGIAAVVLGLILFAAFIFLNQRLSGAEIRSSEEVK